MLRFLHFSDNTKCPPRDNPQYDQLYKLRPLISHFNRQFGSLYTPQKNICVDESLMKYKGRLGFKQYIPAKRSRYGIKLYKLCESASGYVYTFRVYEGKDSHLDPPGCPDFIGTSGKIVWDLINPLLNKGYHLFIDNYYNSIPLLRMLYCFETVACGTIRKTRVGFPKALAQKKLKRGETAALCQDELLALKFKDKKEVFMLTSMHTEHTRRVAVRGRQEIRRVPVCIRQYNKHMGGVDLSDQLLQPYLILRKTRAWYKKLGIYLMQMATHNAFILYKKANADLKSTFLDFQFQLISGLLTECHSGEPSAGPSSRMVATGHFCFRIPPTPKKKTPQKRCRLCYQRGVRTETSFYCPDCPSQPGLCIGNCFKEFHTQGE
ncbi:piggyBac transposable element-derived protein 4-like [Pelobates fuscus]|uniref:piggyBac transposable element-derived protein 4-like n=1 Tax=Pelobates fuscus TaxID=191477 RepID=UPI002FE43BCC